MPHSGGYKVRHLRSRCTRGGDAAAGSVRYRPLHQPVKHSKAPPEQLICISNDHNWVKPKTATLALELQEWQSDNV